jgi:hypothetical protein
MWDFGADNSNPRSPQNDLILEWRHLEELFRGLDSARVRQSWRSL